MPLCGNSIGTDRRFLAAYLPEIEDHLHYRSIDVSSIKELVQALVPEGAPGAPQKTGHHRALDDIRDSIDELRYYRERIFVPPTSAARRDRRPRSRWSDARRRACATATAAPRCSSVTDVDPPVPTPDDLLVDVHGAALNRADLLQRQGGVPRPAPRQGDDAPEIPGMEYAGVVAAVGDRVTGWKVGDEVMGIETGGCYAEQVVTHAPPGPARCRPGSPSPTPPPCPRSSSRRGTRSSCRVG